MFSMPTGRSLSLDISLYLESLFLIKNHESPGFYWVTWFATGLVAPTAAVVLGNLGVLSWFQYSGGHY